MAKTSKQIIVVLKAKLPAGTSAKGFATYVQNEVRSAADGLPSDDPIFDLDRSAVRAIAPDKDFATVVRHMLDNPIACRQAIAALKNNLITKTWFE